MERVGAVNLPREIHRVDSTQQNGSEGSRMRYWKVLAVLMAACLCSAAASAASLYVKALGYDNADVIINRAEARPMWVGQTSLEGVTLRSVAENAAVFEVDRKSVV